MTDYLAMAGATAKTLEHILEMRQLDVGAVRRRMLVENGELAWLFVVLDEKRLRSMTPYISDDVLHHISTALDGRPVLISNSTGLRYAVLLSEQLKLPDHLPYPGWRKGLVQIGVDVRGRGVNVAWERLGHVMAAGMTGSGKSTFMRLLVAQALAEGMALYLVDPDGRTFPGLAGRASALSGTVSGAPGVAEAALAEMERRMTLFRALPGEHDSLETYNQAAERAGLETLPRLLVIVDEFNGLVLAHGGPNGVFARNMTQLVWGGRKFGLHVVVAGQDFEKSVVGPIREQLVTRVAFRVATPSVSRIVLQETGAERLKEPGRAQTNRWGVVQVYEVGREAMGLPGGDGMTDAERVLAERLAHEHGGRMTFEALAGLGYPRRQATRLRLDWVQRGLATRAPGEDNSILVQSGEPGKPDKPGEMCTNQAVVEQAGLSPVHGVEILRPPPPSVPPKNTHSLRSGRYAEFFGGKEYF